MTGHSYLLFLGVTFSLQKKPQIESCLFQIRDVRAEDSGDYECQVAGFEEEEEGEEKEQHDFSFRWGNVGKDVEKEIYISVHFRVLSQKVEINVFDKGDVERAKNKKAKMKKKEDAAEAEVQNDQVI